MRPTDSEQRARRVLLALSGLSAAEVEAAAAASPEPLRGHLSRLSSALQSPDPQAALAALLEPMTADAAALQEQLRQSERAVTDRLGGLRAALERLAAPLAGITLPTDLPDDPDDPVLAAILTEALQLSGGVDLAGVVREAIEEGAALSDELADTLAAARQDPEQTAQAAESIKDRIHRLQGSLSALESASSALPGALGLLARLGRLAEERGHPVAVEIALAEAALWDARGDLPPRLVQQRWRTALDAALRHQHLPQARQAAQRLQLLALSRKDPAAAAVASAEIATLARAKGDRRAEVLALLEESLILAGIHERRDDALRRLRNALARAEGQSAALVARVRLSAGQTLERLGEHGEARRAWRDLIKQPDAEATCPAELGRALLYLGRQEARRGRVENARKILDHARGIGQRTGDWSLYAPALVALLEDRVKHDDIPGSAALIREARLLAVQGGPPAVTAVEGMVDFLRGRWGREAVDRALA